MGEFHLPARTNFLRAEEDGRIGRLRSWSRNPPDRLGPAAAFRSQSGPHARRQAPERRTRRSTVSYRAVLAIEARQLRHGKVAPTIAARGEAIDRQEEPGQLMQRSPVALGGRRRPAYSRAWAACGSARRAPAPRARRMSRTHWTMLSSVAVVSGHTMLAISSWLNSRSGFRARSCWDPARSRRRA